MNALAVLNTPGSCHESAVSVVCCGPTHDVGSVKNGRCAELVGFPPPKQSAGVTGPKQTTCVPRNGSCAGSAGTPHTVNVFPVNGASTDASLTDAVTPKSPPLRTRLSIYTGTP